MRKVDASLILSKMDRDTAYQMQGNLCFETLALCNMKLDFETCTFLDDIRYIDLIAENVKVIFTTPILAEELPENKYGFILTEQPRVLFFKFHNMLAGNSCYIRSKYETKISSNARISNLAYISENNAVVEDGVVIEPFVTIYPNVHIGKNTVVRSGCRIGGEGFEFKKEENGIIPVKHLGGVEIGDNVEIQNNTCIDKAVYPWDNTVIGDNVKIDNLVHIGHGVKVANNTMIVANSGIGGRTEIGENVWVGFASTIRNGLKIENDSRINMGAVVTKGVKEKQAVSGNFAMEHEQFIHHMKVISVKGKEEL
ncbi:UDP-3-O-(3-hydroxymyristoyl)glucosamine N-acyltransferase [bacterium D16-51]|nr:UDP-3-O-(3-hydroxymyristoyl)glucosamine N-acyltransferase [bacterium D16-59]RKI60197.1 UDP-3-O-(3-hydroxymyristoyl)glucosamine N-acyltransferase [bacterium D16-51]